MRHSRPPCGPRPWPQYPCESQGLPAGMGQQTLWAAKQPSWGAAGGSKPETVAWAGQCAPGRVWPPTPRQRDMQRWTHPHVRRVERVGDVVLVQELARGPHVRCSRGTRGGGGHMVLAVAPTRPRAAGMHQAGAWAGVQSSPAMQATQRRRHAQPAVSAGRARSPRGPHVAGRSSTPCSGPCAPPACSRPSGCGWSSRCSARDRGPRRSRRTSTAAAAPAARQRQQLPRWCPARRGPGRGRLQARRRREARLPGQRWRRLLAAGAARQRQS